MYGLSPIVFSTPSLTTATLGPNDPKVGDRVNYNSTDYVFVYNNGASQISTGQGCILTGVSGFSVTVSSVTSVDQLVGVCKHNTIAASAYGWVVTKGFSNVVLSASVSGVAGDILILAADGNFIQKTISTGFVSPALVKLMSACASGASAMAYIDV
jgi:hypothetical protein